MDDQRLNEIRARLGQEYAVPMAGGLHHTDCATMIADLADLLAEVERLHWLLDQIEALALLGNDKDDLDSIHDLAHDALRGDS